MNSSFSPEMHISQAPLAAIDFESAGVARGETDVPVQIGIITRSNDENHPKNHLNSYIFTDKNISWQASKIHGITNVDLQEAPSMMDLWPQVSQLLSNKFILAHNCSTEKRFLGIYPLHNFGPWIDTLELARKLFPGLPSYSLGDLIDAFQLKSRLFKSNDEGLQFHNAFFDAKATLMLFTRMVELSEIQSLPIRSVIELSGQNV